MMLLANWLENVDSSPFYIKKILNMNWVLSRMYFLVLSVVSCLCGLNYDGATRFDNLAGNINKKF